MNLKERIANLVSKTRQNNPENKQELVTLGKLTQDGLEKIHEQTGVELSLDYERIIDNYAIKHTFRKHGQHTQELLRGQIGISELDFEKIPDILENPDKIINGGLSGIGRQIILYQKEINHLYFYAEEVRSNKKLLAMQTLYIRKK